MSISVSRQSYEDCYEVMDRALETKDGIRVGFAEHGEATFFRMRMNQARQLDRKFNKERHELDHPMYGRSEYDALMFRLVDRDGKYWVYAEPRPSQRGVIEEITHEGRKAEAVARTTGPTRRRVSQGYRR